MSVTILIFKLIERLTMTQAPQTGDIGLTGFDLHYLIARMKATEEKRLTEADLQIELKAWKGKGYCPCLWKSGVKTGHVCNAKAYTREGYEGPLCFIHRNTKDVIRLDQLPAPAPPAPPPPMLIQTSDKVTVIKALE